MRRKGEGTDQDSDSSQERLERQQSSTRPRRRKKRAPGEERNPLEDTLRPMQLSNDWRHLFEKTERKRKERQDLCSSCIKHERHKGLPRMTGIGTMALETTGDHLHSTIHAHNAGGLLHLFLLARICDSIWNLRCFWTRNESQIRFLGLGPAGHRIMCHICPYAFIFSTSTLDFLGIFPYVSI